jgi:hypothetical protein
MPLGYAAKWRATVKMAVVQTSIAEAAPRMIR